MADFTAILQDESVQVRFWALVDRRADDECWPWRGTAEGSGYGRFSANGNSVRATQAAWALKHGKPFPAGLFACHSCDNPPCVNPDHIWPGTARQNNQDKEAKGRAGGFSVKNRQKTHCRRGHAFTPENTYVPPAKPQGRHCRQCIQIERAKREKKRPPPTSRHRGVGFATRAQRWYAILTVNGKPHSLGYHKAEDDAARAYNAAARRLLGSAAKLNDVPEETAHV